MPRIHVTTNARARTLQAAVLVILAAGLAIIAALSNNHPEKFARSSQAISNGSTTP
jgi:predicted outer membrane lipoprotein